MSILFFVILLVSLDQISKVLIFKNISLGSSIPILKNILHITPTLNTGIAFGLFQGDNNLILIALSSATIAFIIYLLFTKTTGHRLFSLSLYLILSGAIGNLIDRIFYGHVLDFIDLRVWPVFNIADSCITIGACLVIIHIITRRSKATTKRPRT
ncbi:signal peptidase II [Candidatus Omnitrophota bacterium]